MVVLKVNIIFSMTLIALKNILPTFAISPSVFPPEKSRVCFVFIFLLFRLRSLDVLKKVLLIFL